MFVTTKPNNGFFLRQSVCSRQLGFHLLLILALISLSLIELRIQPKNKTISLRILALALQQMDIWNIDRVVFSAIVFTMGITGLSTYFISQSPGLTNDTRRATAWILENEAETQEVII